jgi:hypothetical protein
MSDTSLYWAFNLPLQVWPMHADPNDENSPVVGARILNYMPRRERCETMDLSELLVEQTRQEVFERAALVLENLARLMREAGADPTKQVYYPDEGLEIKR